MISSIIIGFLVAVAGRLRHGRVALVVLTRACARVHACAPQSPATSYYYVVLLRRTTTSYDYVVLLRRTTTSYYYVVLRRPTSYVLRPTTTLQLLLIITITITITIILIILIILLIITLL